MGYLTLHPPASVRLAFFRSLLGEVPSVGVAPAIANAIYNAVGVRLNRLPFTPDRVLQALTEQRPENG